RGHEDASGTVIGNLFGRGEGDEVALLIFELRVGVGLFLFEQPFELGVLPRGISGVICTETGERLVLGKNDGAGIAAALDHATQGRGNGYAALGIDRVQSAALK